MSIFIAVMNVVPIGSIDVARSGHRQPSTIPMTIATSTCTYNCRYHGFFLTTASPAASFGACVIATSIRARVGPAGALPDEKHAPLAGCSASGAGFEGPGTTPGPDRSSHHLPAQ
ncbi:hypothetical protein [Streptomyces sp. V4I2]|uniref:hypothetical protein n=1 Tax=Streptomyces sp. V4I2 TaxID=3042280 RepID=UPI0027D85CEC|nr:hypothetical protein [Streptomyces sp. V4I2]